MLGKNTTQRYIYITRCFCSKLIICSPTHAKMKACLGCLVLLCCLLKVPCNEAQLNPDTETSDYHQQKKVQ